MYQEEDQNKSDYSAFVLMPRTAVVMDLDNAQRWKKSNNVMELEVGMEVLLLIKR